MFYLSQTLHFFGTGNAGIGGQVETNRHSKGLVMSKLIKFEALTIKSFKIMRKT